MANFVPSIRHSPALISRKIWVTEKFCNFHTVSWEPWKTKQFYLPGENFCPRYLQWIPLHKHLFPKLVHINLQISANSNFWNQTAFWCFSPKIRQITEWFFKWWMNDPRLRNFLQHTENRLCNRRIKEFPGFWHQTRILFVFTNLLCKTKIFVVFVSKTVDYFDEERARA